MWRFRELLDTVFVSDPAVNPPCTVTAGTSFGTTTTVEPDSETSPSPQASTSSCKKVRKRKAASEEQPPVWVANMLTELKEQNVNMNKQLQKIAQEDKRRNDLFEKFLDSRK